LIKGAPGVEADVFTHTRLTEKLASERKRVRFQYFFFLFINIKNMRVVTGLHLKTIFSEIVTIVCISHSFEYFIFFCGCFKLIL